MATHLHQREFSPPQERSAEENDQDQANGQPLQPEEDSIQPNQGPEQSGATGELRDHPDPEMQHDYVAAPLPLQRPQTDVQRSIWRANSQAQSQATESSNRSHSSSQSQEAGSRAASNRSTQGQQQATSREEQESQFMQSIVEEFDRNSALSFPEARQIVNDYSTPWLYSGAFPTLFPYGEGDPTVGDRIKPVTLLEANKHLLCQCVLVNGATTYPFASHERWSFWAQNIDERHRFQGQQRFFSKSRRIKPEWTQQKL